MTKTAYAEYLRGIKKHLAEGDATEHTYRPALERLLDSLDKDLVATNEPRRIACGAPDFVITKGGVPLGYVEAKDLGRNLDEAEASEQLARYLDALPNLILTNYLEFRLYQNGAFVMSASIGRLLPSGKLHQEPTAELVLRPLLDTFLQSTIPALHTPQDLAARMASLARLLRDITARALADDQAHIATLHAQLDAFRRVLLHNISEPEFADMYAQTICYGMFAACWNHDLRRGRFTREAAAFDLPETNPFLRQMFHYIAGPDLDQRLNWVVDHLVELLARSDMEVILKGFGRQTRQEDPVVHFYENFLAAYDPAMREARGVYYTPDPVISYIVRSVDALLKRDFAVQAGLASTEKVPVYRPHPKGEGRKPLKTGEIHRVLILDPAAGTGTFLQGVVDLVHEHEMKGSMRGAWDSYVSQDLLPRLFGFELLMAPYAVCHMKLGLRLAETGYAFKSGERLRVFLTNTLEEAFEHTDLPLFASLIAQEANAAGEVKKDAPVMVVLGNPPYSGHSENNSAWIRDLLRGHDHTEGTSTGSYFSVDGQPLQERNPKWLNDDYVKFIRFAQWRIERTGHGILAFICNHGYLDNPTFRGMRKSLIDTFDDIYILDLHGNTKKREASPDGAADENVFDIQQGVAIGIFVRRSRGSNPRRATLHHAELWGPREVFNQGQLSGGKYAELYATEVQSTAWTDFPPQGPHYLFIPQDSRLLEEYHQGWSLAEAMPVNSVGMVTARDKLTIHFSQDDLWQTIKDFSGLSPDAARVQYKLGPDVLDWKVAWAQQDLLESGPGKENVLPMLYRPFDVRWTYYTGKSRGFICRPRSEVMRHMLAGENVALSTTRSIEIGRGWEHVFCSSLPIQHHTVSNKEVNYLFPLYLYPKAPEDATDLIEVAEAAEFYGTLGVNLAPEFVRQFSELLRLEYLSPGTGDLKKSVGAEDIFAYIYAVLHAPSYRERYASFLKRDFPRIPLTRDKKLFRALVRLGARLLDAHLMKADELPEVTTFSEAGTNRVEKIRYDAAHQRVYINQTQHFSNISQKLWELHIGGYRVCEKWLKDRCGQTFTRTEIEQYLYIVSALQETLDSATKIDAAILKVGGWPLP